MRVLILGATGGTGMEIIRQTIARGHSVTAFVRSPEKLDSFAGLLTVERGNPLDSSALRRLLRATTLYYPHLDLVYRLCHQTSTGSLCSGAVERVARSWGQASDPRIGSILSSRML